MADEKQFKGGRLGPFHLSRRYREKNKEVGADLGRVYEAHNVHTGGSALVLIPGSRVGWEPQQPWQVRASCEANPPYVALEVEQAPASGRLPELAEMLDVLTSAVERVEKSEEARVHLTREPVGLLKRWTGRARRLLRSRGRSRFGLVVVGLATLALGVGLLLRTPAAPVGRGGGRQPVVALVAAEADAPKLIATKSPGMSVIGYPLPGKPFRNQAKAPCIPRKGEVEINGGCWVELAKRPPCYDDQAEYQGKCYLPVAKRDESEPRAFSP